MKPFELPARRILELIAPDIERRAYDSLLSDDSGSRIHSLVLAQAIQDLYGSDKRLNLVFVQDGKLLNSDESFEAVYTEDEVQGSPLLRKMYEAGVLEVEFEEDGFGGVEVRYLLRRSTTHRDEVRDYLSRMSPRLGRKTLIVTEEVYSGSTVNALAEMLRGIGIQAEAAAYGTAFEEEGEAISNPWMTSKGVKIYLGNVYRNGPIMRPEYLGIVDSARSGFGHPVRQRPTGNVHAMRIVAARRAAKELGHRLADWCRAEGRVF